MFYKSIKELIITQAISDKKRLFLFMYSIYIDNIKLEESEIDGFDSIKVEKSLSEIYWGYWNADGFGFSESDANGQIIIYNKEVSSYIKQTFKKFGFRTEIKVTITNENTGQKVEMYINFAEYKEVDCCYVSFTLRPVGGGELLKARDKVEYPVSLITEIEVPIRDLPETVNFKVPNATFIGVSDKNHSVPLTINENGFTGISQSVDTLATNFFLQSTGCVNINGSIKVNVSSGIVGTFDVILVHGVTEILIDTFPIGLTLVEQTISISESLTTPLENFYLKVVGTDGGQFIYDDSSAGLSVEKCTFEDIDWRKVRAVALKDCFSSVIGQATNQTAQLGEYIFDNEVFEMYLTNNEGLQGRSSVVNVSFFDLFDELNNKYPSSVDIDGKVNILLRELFMTTGDNQTLNLSEVTREVNSKLLFSNVKVGYNNWKADKPFSALEYNSTREFQSDFTISSNTLSLLNDWSASSSLISEQIIKEKQKEEIHVILVIKETLKAETDQYIDASVYNPDRAINLRITPTRNLSRWMKFILNNLTFVSGSGNYNFDSVENGITLDETQDLDSQSILEAFIYSGEIDSCEISLSKLKGLVEFEYCNEIKKGFVKDVKYEISQTQDEIIKIEILGIN